MTTHLQIEKTISEKLAEEITSKLVQAAMSQGGMGVGTVKLLIERAIDEACEPLREELGLLRTRLQTVREQKDELGERLTLSEEARERLKEMRRVK